MLKHTKLASSVSNSLGKIFAWIPLHPNSITILSVILAILGYFAWLPQLEHKVQSIILFALAFFFDAIDGAVARVKKLESKQGAFLDGMADRVVEFFLILTLLKIYAFNFEMQMLLFVILFFGTGMTSFVKAYAEHQQLLSHKEAIAMPGLFERTERSIVLIALFLFVSFDMYGLARQLTYIIAGLSIITFAERFWHVYKK